MGLGVALVGVHADVDPAQALGQQGLLSGANHAHGDVGFALEQIFVLVGQHQLDGDLRVACPVLGQQGGQHLAADDLAGGDPHGAALIFLGARDHARGLLHRGGHGFDRIQQFSGHGRGREPALGTDEQGHAKGLFQGIDVPAHAGLCQVQCTRGGRQAALAHHRQE